MKVSGPQGEMCRKVKEIRGPKPSIAYSRKNDTKGPR